MRALQEDELAMLLAWRNDDRVRSFMYSQHVISPEEHAAWFEKASRDSRRKLLLADTDDGPIGFVQFSPAERDAASEWGFYARPGVPSGSGRRLGMAAIDYAFDRLQVHKVCGQALSTNAPSIKMHRALRFTEEGFLREQQRVGGFYQSVICFGLLRREWQQHREAEPNGSF